MAQPTKEVLEVLPFELVSIDPATAPAGASGKQWHQYVIAQGSNVITGLRRGNLASVTEAVERMLEQMNARRQGKRANARSPTASRSPATR